MVATTAGTLSREDETPPTPIWIPHRVQIALIMGALALLALAVWRVPSILTIVLGGVG